MLLSFQITSTDFSSLCLTKASLHPIGVHVIVGETENMYSEFLKKACCETERLSFHMVDCT